MEPEPILTLLKIADLAKQWPALKPIHDLALAELTDAAVTAQGELTDRALKLAAIQAEAKAKRDAKAKAEAEAVAKAAEDVKTRTAALAAKPAPIVPPPTTFVSDGSTVDRRDA